MNGELKKKVKEQLKVAQGNADEVQDDINALLRAGIDATQLQTQHRELQRRITRLRGLFG